MADLLIENIGQLCVMPTLNGGPQRGAAFGTLGLVEHAVVAIRDGAIRAVGTGTELRREYPAARVIDARGRLVTPGLIDPHTHLVWAGDRAGEFELRRAGTSYQEIMAAGGGINKTVRDTRAASLETIIAQSTARLNRMLLNGSTTVEAKTGYGLDLETELRLLDAIAQIDTAHPVDLVPTLLAAHAVPPEYEYNADDYVRVVCEQIIPAAAAWHAQHGRGTLFCDAFCEHGAFTLEQSRRVLEAGRAAGLTSRLHADEFASLGGVALAVELGAASVDHLLVTTPEDCARLGASQTAAVLLPTTPFGLNIANSAPAAALIAAGAALAIATDCNPGTAWCESMQFVLALAVRTLGLTQAQALAAATINAAHAAGRLERVGSIEPGKRADLLIWDILDYRQLGYVFGANLVDTVIKDGRVVIERGIRITSS